MMMVFRNAKINIPKYKQCLFEDKICHTTFMTCSIIKLRKYLLKDYI